MFHCHCHVSPLYLKTPKTSSFFNVINIFDTFYHTLLLFLQAACHSKLDGIHCEQADVMFYDVKTYHNKSDGICFDEHSTATLLNCKSYDNGMNGVSSYSSSKIHVRGKETKITNNGDRLGNWAGVGAFDSSHIIFHVNLNASVYDNPNGNCTTEGSSYVLDVSE